MVRPNLRTIPAHMSKPLKITQRIINLLIPNKSKISLFVLFLFIAYCAYTIGWVFSDPKITGVPKPLFYDQIASLPGSSIIWALGSFLFLLAYPLHCLLDFFESPKYVINLIGVLYLYILACSIISALNSLTRNFHSRK